MKFVARCTLCARIPLGKMRPEIWSRGRIVQVHEAGNVKAPWARCQNSDNGHLRKQRWIYHFKIIVPLPQKHSRALPLLVCVQHNRYIGKISSHSSIYPRKMKMKQQQPLHKSLALQSNTKKIVRRLFWLRVTMLLECVGVCCQGPDGGTLKFRHLNINYRNGRPAFERLNLRLTTSVGWI